ncbi:mevalonate kinase [Fructilactobacillus myrtifloralis]|uniref:mevalonate kinase n=1 Tax=Fructilactobacillus myrtifloralis TaxID=2940301 RepID=A0ABY5BNQ9_9LACO|nr:mevalonate kinase [Fructilactobacillus myrtifloralis]USS85319.1 mevalonate kinase [Fructilactobacillus myrtifloralis]
MKTTATGKSHAKVIFLGEHSAVYQQPAIVFPVPQATVTATIKTTNAPVSSITSEYYTGPVSELPPRMAGVATLLHHLQHQLNPQSIPTHLTLHSTIPLGRGMGSSAAIASAITQAYFALFETPLPRETLTAYTDIEEHITHGNPSGIDAQTVNVAHPILFEEQQFIDFQPPLTGFLVIADTGLASDTKTAVQQVHQFLTADQQRQDLILQLGKLTERVKQELQQQDLLATGHSLTAAQTILRALGVSTPQIDQLVTAAHAAGALGAKLTGSGLGGCIIALTETRAAAQTVAKALTEHGATQTWIQSLHELNPQEDLS